jgi:hypothetical protein
VGWILFLLRGNFYGLLTSEGSDSAALSQNSKRGDLNFSQGIFGVLVYANDAVDSRERRL